MKCVLYSPCIIPTYCSEKYIVLTQITASKLCFDSYQNRFKTLVVTSSSYVKYKTMQVDVQTGRSTCVPAALLMQRQHHLKLSRNLCR